MNERSPEYTNHIAEVLAPRRELQASSSQMAEYAREAQRIKQAQLDYNAHELAMRIAEEKRRKQSKS